MQGFTRYPCGNCREHEARTAAVDEMLARPVRYRLSEKRPDPTVSQTSPGTAGNAALMTGAHGQQVPYGHRRQVVADHGRAIIRKKFHHLVVQRQTPVIDQQAYGGCGPALGGGMLNMRAISAIRRPVSLGDYSSGAVKHKAVQLQARSIDRLDKVTDAASIDAFFARQRSGQVHVCH